MQVNPFLYNIHMVCPVMTRKHVRGRTELPGLSVGNSDVEHHVVCPASHGAALCPLDVGPTSSRESSTGAGGSL